MNELAQVFNNFASFGSGRSKSGNDVGSSLLMDGRALQKLCKDCQLIYPPLLTTVDVDIIFKKVKPRSESKIDFIEFVECTRLFAEKLRMEHVDLIEKILLSDGPSLNTSINYSPPTISSYSHSVSQFDTSNISSSSDEKLYRPTKEIEYENNYYGSDKNISHPRSYNDTNTYQGQIASSSSSIPKIKNDVAITIDDVHPDWYPVKNPNPTSEFDLIYYANRFTNETTWEKPTPPPPPPLISLKKQQLQQTPIRNVSTYTPIRQTQQLHENRQAYNIPSSQRIDNQQQQNYYDNEIYEQQNQFYGQDGTHEQQHNPHRNIFDKLTDSSLYTGSHKNRFDATGRGLGLAGRDSTKKGNGYATAGATSVPTSFKGNTNTRSNEVFHDLSEFVQRR